MRPFIAAFLLSIAATLPLPAQENVTLAPIDSLIEHSLRWFDLPRFELTDSVRPRRPVFGVYTQEIPADTLKTMKGFPAGTRGFRIWHVMPNHNADLGGVFIGDIIYAVEGKPIGDSAFPAPDDYIGNAAREKAAGDSLRVSIYRDEATLEVAVPLAVRDLAPVPPPEVGTLGAIRRSWLAEQIDRFALGDWAATVRKQIRTVADFDENSVPYAGRPHPWRLSAVTYLDFYPMRTGAYSRAMVRDIWSGQDRGPGLAGALSAIGEHLDIDPLPVIVSRPPRNLDELKTHLGRVQTLLDSAYSRLGDDVPGLVAELVEMLNVESDPEVSLEKIEGRIERRTKRVEEEGKIATAFDRADKLDRTALLEAGAMMGTLADSAWLRGLAADAERVRAPKNPIDLEGAAGDIVASWLSPSGVCVIGGKGSNTYTAQFALIIDLGGDDRYELGAPKVGTVRLIADMAGDDDYRSTTNGQGSGLGAVDLLADLSGNDTYQATSWAQGAGVMGVGILADFAGDDSYRSRWCSQGGGFLGIGLLFDGSGADSYIAEMYSQAFGYARGFGVILEEGGNDSYRAGWMYEDYRLGTRHYLSMSQGCGFGMRPWGIGVNTDGGIGVLADRSGDDVYAGDFFCQGVSYWYALGVLYDRQGHDRYTAGQYSQGSGIHLSFGALLDDQGNDMYDATAALNQGNAHDWSAGCLEDWEGNDTYRAAGASQGCALNASLAWLLDSRGNDGYYVALTDTTLSQAGGNMNPPRKSGVLSTLVDLGKGRDYYVEQRARPGTAIVKSYRGILYDDGEE